MEQVLKEVVKIATQIQQKKALLNMAQFLGGGCFGVACFVAGGLIK